MYQHILIATDGSELATGAVEHGLRLARSHDAKATVITVTEPWSAHLTGDVAVSFPIADFDEAMAEHARAVLKGVEASAGFTQGKHTTAHIKDAGAADGIVAEAKSRGCDLIVMASNGRRGVSRMLLGSQANRVVSMSEVPVLIWRPRH